MARDKYLGSMMMAILFGMMVYFSSVVPSGAAEVPLTPESYLEPGQRVRVKTGRFKGFEGTIIRRENEQRLLVAVNFLQQGASLLVEDFEVELI